MTEDVEPEPTCPTPTAHRRLEEGHRFWHECLEGYQNPEEFRIKLNAAIQALRNLTFALQKEKHLIPEFDVWYGGWVDQMKADPIMRWIKDARTTVVHVGDLETSSIVRIRLIATYFDAAEEVASGLPRTKEAAEFVSSPSSTLGGILDEIKAVEMPRRLLEQSTVSVERRWVDQQLPDIELLDALAHVYGFLGQMISDAHRQAGVTSGTFLDFHGEPIALDASEHWEGRLPCMITSRADRTLYLAMRDGQPTTGGLSWTLPPDTTVSEKAAKRYKAKPVVMQKYPTSPIDFVPQFIESAKSILLSGDQHGWFILFYKGIRQVATRALMARDTLDKRALAQEIAELVAMNGIDGIIEIGEAWTSPMLMDDEGFVLPRGRTSRAYRSGRNSCGDRRRTEPQRSDCLQAPTVQPAGHRRDTRLK